MIDSALEKFEKIRREQNDIVMEYAGRDLKRFFSLDATVYDESMLSSQTKELIGLTTSTVLRCDDCVKYHLMRLHNIGISDNELVEALTVAMVVGGSITIPHIRRALVFWDSMNTDEIANMESELAFEKLENLADRILKAEESFEEKLAKITRLLWKNVEHYDWVGFYMVNDDPKILELGPFTGAETEHTHIPFGEGICGQAAENRETMVIQDVSQEDNYLSCSIDVKSEIVVPIIKSGEIIGEIDIDSHSEAPFTKSDEALLRNIASRIAETID